MTARRRAVAPASVSAREAREAERAFAAFREWCTGKRATRPPATARDRARLAEVAELREEFRHELVAAVGSAKAARWLEVIDENSDGEFFDELLFGGVDLGDPYGEHPTLPIVLDRVLRARLDARLAQREGRGASGRRATESRTKSKEARNKKLRKLARDMQGATPKGSPPVNAAAVRLRLETFAVDREHVLGAGAKPADVPSAETIRRALRKA